jgi:hypothetical protein
MAQAVSRPPLTADAGVQSKVVGEVALGQVFIGILRFSLSISFHRGSPYSHITWGMLVAAVRGYGLTPSI